MAKPTGEITLAAQPVKVGAQWHVVGTYPSGQQERITGFKTEADALDWIANDSAGLRVPRSRLPSANSASICLSPLPWRQLAAIRLELALLKLPRFDRPWHSLAIVKPLSEAAKLRQCGESCSAIAHPYHRLARKCRSSYLV